MIKLCKVYHAMNRLYMPMLTDAKYVPYKDVSAFDFIISLSAFICMIVISPFIILCYTLNGIRLAIMHMYRWVDSIKLDCNDLNQIAGKDAGTASLIEQLETVELIIEPMCTNCHYYINNNCPIQDIMGSTYQCSYYEYGGE